jgi:phosphonate transport system ATP-binding protein
MELLRDLSRELKLPVLINIHNVTEAKTYTDRIVGMRFGRIIFDDEPARLDDAAMERIYSGSPAEDRRADAPVRSGRQAEAQAEAQPS